MPEVSFSDSLLAQSGYDQFLYKDGLLNYSNIGAESSSSVGNPITDSISPGLLLSGSTDATVTWDAGSIRSGKAKYDNTETGYIIGVDESDSLVKFYIGNTTSYLNWTGTGLTIAGTLIASSIHIPDEDTTANSFHVDTTGAGWVGATETNRATAPMRWTAAGILTAAGAIISGVFTVGATSSGIANFSDGGDLVTVDEANVDALALTNAPAEAGADVTSGHTSADTALVNAVAAATVEEGASKAYTWRHATDVTKIDGGDIYTNTVTATQINVSQLSAIAADMGTITAGTITGAIVQTDVAASTGIKMISTSLKGYDTNNDETFNLDASTGSITLKKYTGAGGVDIQGALVPTEVLEAGENMTAGDAYCILGQEQYQVECAKSSYVQEGNPDTNYDGITFLDIAIGVGVNKYAYIEFDISSTPAAAERAYLRVYVPAAHGFRGDIWRVTSTWDEATLTWNNKPTDSGVAEVVDINPAGNGQYVYIDITTVYNQWKAGTYTNYGLVFYNDTYGSGRLNSDDHGTAAFRPQLFVFGVSSNSGKAYKADADDYEKAINFRGFVTEDVTSGNNFQGQIGGIYDSLSGLVAGYKYYLSDTAGSIDITPGTFQRECGIATSTTDIAIQREDTISAMGYESNVVMAENTPRFFVCGFKPRMIMFEINTNPGVYTDPKALQFIGATQWKNNAVWTSGEHIGIKDNGAANEWVISTSYIFEIEGGANDWGIKVSDVLDLGFVLEYVVIAGATVSDTIGFTWYAFK